jgi:hypothetical protein
VLSVHSPGPVQDGLPASLSLGGLPASLSLGVGEGL